MRLADAVRNWLDASTEGLSRRDCEIAEQLIDELETGDFADLTTSLSLDEELAVIAASEAGELDRVAHVFRSALYTHPGRTDRPSGLADPPQPGALPPPVVAAPAPSSPADPSAEAAPASTARNPPSTQSGPHPIASVALLASLFAVAIGALAYLAFAQLGNDSATAASSPTSPTPPAAPTLQPDAPLPTATPTTNLANQAGTEPTPTPRPTDEVGQPPSGLLGDAVALRPLNGQTDSAPAWTVRISPARISDPASASDLPADYRILAFDVTVTHDDDAATPEQPLRNPRLIFVGGDSDQPNLGGGPFTCPANGQLWQDYVGAIEEDTAGTKCFIEPDADIMSPRSRVLFAADGYEVLVFALQ